MALLAGCGSRDPCPPVRKAALDAVDHSLHAARTELEVLDNAAEESPMKSTQLELSRIAFDEKLEKLESAMDCVAHEDCCVRLAKVPLADRAKLVPVIHDVMAHTPVPDPLIALLAPAAKLIDKGGPSSTVASEVTDWCVQLRGAIARVRVTGPDEWKRVEEAAEVEEAQSDAAIAFAQTRVDALEAWQKAIAAKKRPTPAPDQTLLDDAWPAIDGYLATCKP
jgi:hypothetical protein